MNPWMQGVSSDVHTALIGYIRDSLGEELPDDLLARAEERVTLSSPKEANEARRVDVSINEPETWKQGTAPLWTPEDDPGLAERVAQPVLVEIDDVVERWVEIRSSKGKLITIIEVTSPANKTRDGRWAFDRKLRDFLSGGVNVVEIDLIRGGLSARAQLPGKWPEAPCSVIAIRAHHHSHVEVYPCPLRDPLPAVRIPLRTNEPDAALDLQPLIDRCYSRGRYWMLPYREEPQPPLDEAEQAWAEDLLRAADISK